MTVTALPNRANTDANSIPTAPAPITTRERGIWGICRISSDEMISLPSRASPGSVRGREPVARSTFVVLIFVSPASLFTTTVPGPSRRA